MDAETKPAPIAKPLWRLGRADRKKALRPFVGRRVKIEVWPGRLADDSGHVYEGLLVIVATTTTHSNADLAVITTIHGTTWALSLAQIAKVEAL